MKQDRIEKIGNSVIQHGHFNDRVYLLKFSYSDFPGIIDKIEIIAEREGYTKIFAKVPQNVLSSFIQSGYHIEAFIPKYFFDGNDAVFVSKFSDPRRRVIEKEKLDSMSQMMSCLSQIPENTLPHGFSFRKLSISDKNIIVEVYTEVFETYPFPIHDPSYIEQTMGENLVYFGIFHKNRLVAISSSEADYANHAIEMTDFAVRPEFRGRKFALILLNKMEKSMVNEGFSTFYTIARLNSPAMNKTFLNSGYRYTGTLIKNTNISGSIESMNVLYKKSKLE